MASRPGILTDWPWKPLGSFKYLILAPWVLQNVYSFFTADEKQWDLSNFLLLLLLPLRAVQNQIWTSYSRYRTANGSNRIVDKSIEFEQVDREINWDDQILFNGILFYLGTAIIPGGKNLPMWRADGAILTLLLHAGPVEFLYYWFHRALHHHFLYSRYHSHHHSSIATEPMTSVSHPFAEHIVYYALFAIPMVTAGVTGVASVGCVAGYIFYLDLMNNMGHCNFEFIPKWVFSVFPPLKYFMYTPSFHSLHHTRLGTNYSLFMPFYDYIYGTVDVSTDDIHTDALKREEDEPQVVHLTHLTTPESIYHTRLGFAAFASRPYATKWFMWLMWPVTVWSVMWNRIYGRTVVTERNRFQDLTLQTWIIPKYKFQVAQMII
uniref:Fatty acid hydroxylase domain-containing protein n=1 Tax=Kalanchoe fedtschenkoi TaxID=63787 RepID=A0A7N0RGI3_KALFE